MGILLGHLLCPSGTVGVGMFSVAPPLPDGEPANIRHVCSDLYVPYKINLLSLFANPYTLSLTRPPGVQPSRPPGHHTPRTDAHTRRPAARVQAAASRQTE
jgi:hypothetical protein